MAFLIAFVIMFLVVFMTLVLGGVSKLADKRVAREGRVEKDQHISLPPSGGVNLPV
ncbi:hypothetical protein [Archangium primigenium]|uniref:hypothetical protein n=1 Tax=[Archangium] primigenium TaxID=2792470 RepID=UPI00195C08FB|nr:hypothetical protein [Archangium primigenium]MBM7119271.1 hypothetical protein [Archangium primigenium]